MKVRLHTILMGALLLAVATGVQADTKIQGAAICNNTTGATVSQVQGMRTTSGIHCGIVRDNTATTTGLSSISLDTVDNTLCSVTSLSTATGANLDSAVLSRTGVGNHPHNFSNSINVSANGTSFYTVYCTDTGGGIGYLRSIRYTEN
jgi:hypothetical protein